ncbi:MAG: DsbA family oxidoreductase [Alphaproteobacteria bacterium]
MLIEVYSDTVCPWCFVGKRRLERTLAMRPGLSVEVRWRPFQLNPDMPRQGMARDTYLALKFGGAARARQIHAMIARSGREEGIDFEFDTVARTPNTLDSHRLIRWAAAHGGEARVAEALFQAYFLDGVDIGDLRELGRIARACGLDGPKVDAYLASDRDVDAVMAEDLRARRMGIEGVPCFIIDGRYALAGAQEPEAFFPLLDLAAVTATPLAAE